MEAKRVSTRVSRRMWNCGRCDELRHVLSRTSPPALPDCEIVYISVAKRLLDVKIRQNARYVAL